MKGSRYHQCLFPPVLRCPDLFGYTYHKPGQGPRAEVAIAAHSEKESNNSTFKKYTSLLGKAPHAGTQLKIQGTDLPSCRCSSGKVVGVRKAAYPGGRLRSDACPSSLAVQSSQSCGSHCMLCVKIQAQKLTQEPNRYVNPNTEHEAKLPNNQQPKRYLVQTTLSQEHSSPNKFKTLQIAKLSFTTHKTTCHVSCWFDLFTYLFRVL